MLPSDAITVDAPASKSVSHRACIGAALAPGQSRLTNVLRSVDLSVTRECLSAMGASFTEQDNGDFLVEGMPRGPKGGSPGAPVDLDMKESGTSCRILTAIAAAGKGAFRVHGEGRMHERPIGELTTSLRDQGVEFAFEEIDGYPPFVMNTDGLAGGEVSISLEESSQYLSGLLLAAPLAGATTRVLVTGKKIVSWPYVALTLQTMFDAGIDFTVMVMEQGVWTRTSWRNPAQGGAIRPGRLIFEVKPGRYAPGTYVVEGDWSNASYFLAAGAVGSHPVAVRGLRRDSVQGDRAILNILAKMGAKVEWTQDDVVVVHPATLRGVELDMGSCPDLVPTVAVVAAFAYGETTIRNVAHLRIKESDRLEAMATQVAKVGAKTKLLDDGIVITPGALPIGKTIACQTYSDHRVAMSLSLLELAGIRVGLDDPGCTAKSFPDFFERWEKIREGATT
jgi:3-phosphoshikimate 1-carboxyvinyltransferase